MSELDPVSIVISIAITWGIGLAPPLATRNIIGKPLNKWPAIGACAVFWFLNLVIFNSLGSQSESHTALLLVAFVSYWILRKGALANREIQSSDVGHNGFTELMLASASKSVSDVCVVLATGVNVNERDEQGKTALMYAVMNNRLDVIKLLLDVGADKTIRTNSGNTAAWFAEKQEFERAIALLNDSAAK